MRYEDAIEYYASHGKFSHAPGLGIMRELCRLLGDPQDGLRFVHIAGTNGKGSCAALTASHPARVRLPDGTVHLSGPHGHPGADRRDGVDITPDDFTRLTERVARAAETYAGPLLF